MNFKDFFIATNIDHIIAYRHLCDKGCWPEGFIPEGTVFDPGW